MILDTAGDPSPPTILSRKESYISVGFKKNYIYFFPLTRCTFGLKLIFPSRLKQPTQQLRNNAEPTARRQLRQIAAAHSVVPRENTSVREPGTRSRSQEPGAGAGAGGEAGEAGAAGARGPVAAAALVTASALRDVGGDKK